MYRAVTLFCNENNFFSGNKLDHAGLLKVLPSLKISFSFSTTNHRYETWLNGKNVEDSIRQIGVSEKVSLIAKIREVRQQMVKMQRSIGREKGIVMDGRDIGTVVFPEADLKIFMTASLEVLTDRRYKELIEKGEQVTREDIMENLKTRDEIDSSREESPLRQASDAVVLDNSHMTPDEQMRWLEKILAEKKLI